MDKHLIKIESAKLYNDIDSCIGELIKARLEKDHLAEGKALFRMEGLMVVTQQHLSWLMDEVKNEESEKKDRYMEGYNDGYKAGQESTLFHHPLITFNPGIMTCANGGPCTNPFQDGINCPRMYSNNCITQAKTSKTFAYGTEAHAEGMEGVQIKVEGKEE